MMRFSKKEFQAVLQGDLWVLDEMAKLPEDPPPKIIHDGETIRVESADTVYLPQIQEAVRAYRRKLVPLIFFVGEKIYAELFRLVLSWSDRISSTAQVSEVEKRIRPLISSKTLRKTKPFHDFADLQNWWSGKYVFKNLREARNLVAHGNYQFQGARFIVEKHCRVLIDWDETEVLEFAAGVLRLARSV